MTDVITMLRQDHREVERMAAALDSAPGLEEKKQVARRVIRELAAHAAVEEVLVYPALRMKVKDGGERLADHSVEEHQQVKLLLDEAEHAMQKFPDMDRFMPEVRAAVSATRHHIEEDGSAAAQLLAGPLLSVADHVRDFLEKLTASRV